MSIAFPFFGPNSPESKMVEKMTLMWAQFAKTGKLSSSVYFKLVIYHFDLEILRLLV
jgi:hypothetical protein